MPESSKAAGGDLRLQLLGLAFAASDMVFEVDGTGRITFALGAAEQLAGRGANEMTGLDWAELVSEADADLLAALLGGLKPGERQGPLTVGLRAKTAGGLERRGSLSVFRLPERDDRISCALSLGAMGPEAAPRRANGLLERETFSAAAAELLQTAEEAGLPVRLDLVELDGLSQAVAAMTAPDAALIRRKVAATLRADSIAGLGASEIAADRFALLRSADASSDRLAENLRQATGAGVSPVMAELPMRAATALQNLRAMRYALDRYIEDGPQAAQASFVATLQRTAEETDRFKALLAAGAFHLAYQPVVSLADQTLHHYEALARFHADASPADTIKLAEELRLIADFDLSVAATAAKALRSAPPPVRIAANVSGVSLMQPGFVEALLGLAGDDPDLRPRLLFEVTETHKLEGLEGANMRLAALRKAGHLVCLDDFGAGAASLEYLRHLDVDIVKIDGRYIQALDAANRDALLVKHVVALCADLGVSTIAEMIETSQTARLATELGVTMGQGWHFGRPVAEPKWTEPPAAPARRVGLVEQWR